MFRSLPVSLLGILALTACGSSFAVGDAPFAKGQKVTIEQSTSNTVNGKMTGTPMGDMEMEVATANTVSTTLEVLEAGDEGASKVKVSFDKATMSMKMSLMNIDKPAEDLPVAGKTYTVDLSDESAPKVSAEDGGAVDAQFEPMVVGIAKMVGKKESNDIRSCIPDGPLEVGLSIDLAKCQGSLLGEGAKGFEVSNAKLNLTKIGPHSGREAAHFDLAMNMKGSGASGPQPEVDIKGVLVIDGATGRILKLDMKGPLTLKGSQGGATVDGTGTLEMNQSLTFL